MSNTPTLAMSNVKSTQTQTKVTNPMKNNIIITTINVNGLKNQKKVNYLKNFLEKNNVDIACLQEVGTNIKYFESERYRTIENATKNNLGTAILIKTNLQFKNTQKDSMGRIIKIEVNGMYIINVYGYPSGASYTAGVRKRFFTETMPKYLSERNKITFLLGDFNAVTSKKENGNYSPDLINLLKATNLKEILSKKKSQATFIGTKGHSRIDRIYINSEIEGEETIETVNYEESDHRAVLLRYGKIKKQPKRSVPYWRMNTEILDEIDYQENVKIAIGECCKLKINYKNSIAWWEDCFKPQVRKMTVLYCKNREKDRRSTENFKTQLLNELAEKMEEGESNREKQYREIKNSMLSKSHYMKGIGVRGSFKYPIQNEKIGTAHLKNEKKKRDKKEIIELKDQHKVKITEKSKANYIKKFYSNLYKLEKKPEKDYDIFLKNIKTKVTQKENEEITKLFSLQEIKEAVDDLKEEKAPGIDGFPGDFYKTFFDILKTEMINLYNDIMRTGKIPKSFKTSAISLIHKGNEKYLLKNWRPISLLCLDYKILAKLMANRLKRLLPNLIHVSQTGAIPNREIVDNLTNIRNLISNATKHSPGAILSLDFEKAFDRVDRNTIYKIMTQMNFSKTYIKWIKTLYENSKAKVILNGVLGKKIIMNRGVKQGCPLAAMLYILYIEPLHLKLQDEIKGIRIGPKIAKTSGFVDDLVIFASTESDLTIAGNVLDIFEKVTNSKLNKMKTQLLPIGKWEEKKDWPLTWLETKNRIKKVKILGIEFTNKDDLTIELNGKKCIENYRVCLMKANERILTIQQKIFFINTYAIPIPGFVASIYPLKQKVTNKIQSITNKFIWQSSHEQLAINQQHGKEEKGGLNLINCKAKFQSLFINNLIKQLKKEDKKKGGDLSYLLGFKNPLKVKNNNLPKKDATPKIFRKAIEIMTVMTNQNPELNWQNTDAKSIYQILVKPETAEPRIIKKNPERNHEQIFKNINNKYLTPLQREHVMKQAHDILPTKQRLKRCHQSNGDKCTFCGEVETAEHHIWCNQSKPILEWTKRKLYSIETTLRSYDIVKIFYFDFKITNNKKNNSVTWLIAAMSLAIWKARKKGLKKINTDVFNQLGKELDKLKNKYYYKKHFEKIPGGSSTF